MDLFFYIDMEEVRSVLGVVENNFFTRIACILEFFNFIRLILRKFFNKFPRRYGRILVIFYAR